MVHPNSLYPALTVHINMRMNGNLPLSISYHLIDCLFILNNDNSLFKNARIWNRNKCIYYSRVCFQKVQAEAKDPFHLMQKYIIIDDVDSK